MLRRRRQRQRQLCCQLHNDSDESGDNDDNDDGDGDSGDDGDNDHKGDGDGNDGGDSGDHDDNSEVINNDDGGGGGGRRATAAVGGMVWGRRQVAEAAEMGIKQKWEQCGYDRWKFLYRKIVTWIAFYMYPTAFPGY